MNPSPIAHDRRLVPRWRSLAVTAQAGELAHPRRIERSEISAEAISPELLIRLERWQLSPNLISAAELVETAIVEGRENDAVDAARRLADADSNATPLIRDQSIGLLHRVGDASLGDRIQITGLHSTTKPRLATRLHPHDPLAWVELALAQTTHGAPDSAERSMLVALSLAPANRHVLRSAARLFLHMNDPDRACALLSTNTATRTDPWLMSAEIALAQVAHRNPRSLKLGTALLRSGEVHPRHLTELAGSIATEELINGKRKLARRAFQQSLRDPNGNAAAQGEWAGLALNEELVSEGTLKNTFENGEASAFHLYRISLFKEAVRSCSNWSQQDPFSIRPFEFAATTAGLDDDYVTAIDFANRGLELRSASTVLLNALAFAYGSLGNVDEAAGALARVKVCDDPIQRHVLLANKGLLSFRRGDHDAGRKAYQEAIDGFKKAGLAQFATRARVYYAREAMLAKTQAWEEILREAENAMEKHPDRDTTQCIGRIKKQASALVQSIEEVGPVDRLPKPSLSTSVTFNF